MKVDDWTWPNIYCIFDFWSYSTRHVRSFSECSSLSVFGHVHQFWSYSFGHIHSVMLTTLVHILVLILTILFGNANLSDLFSKRFNLRYEKLNKKPIIFICEINNLKNYPQGASWLGKFVFFRVLKICLTVSLSLLCGNLNLRRKKNVLPRKYCSKTYYLVLTI